MDFTPPQALLSIPDPPNRLVEDGGVDERDPLDDGGFALSWRRDERLTLRLSSLSEDFDPLGTVVQVGDFVLPGANAGWVVTGTGAEVTLELWRPTLRAFRAGLPETVTVADRAGHTTSIDGGGHRGDPLELEARAARAGRGRD